MVGVDIRLKAILFPGFHKAGAGLMRINMKFDKKLVLSITVAAFLAAPTAMADKPANAGGQGKGKQSSNMNASQGKNKTTQGNSSGKQTRNNAKHKGQTASKTHERNYGDERRGNSTRLSVYFNDQQRSYIRDYYTDEFRAGRCPPGLAKKHNGCMPPGQAKKWRIGYPLGRDVIYYDLSPAIVARIGLPPDGYRYARVASDILLLAVGTGLVVDAITDLSAL
jgi:Ni/Co efflux regulator RcnB